MNITLVAPGNVDAVWPHIAEMVADAVQKHNTDASAGDYWTGSRTGNFFLIVAHDEKPVAATFWRFETWNSGPVLNNLLTSGEPHRADEWIPDCREFVNGMALANGVKSFVWRGPRGWKQFFPDAEAITCNYRMEVRA